MASAVKYLSQDDAINLDQELFNTYKYSVDQLMELAGLSVATAVAQTYPCNKFKKPLICCGPGNNGGDGLVCARHLKLFGYQPIVVCPRPGRTSLYENLLTLCSHFDIPVHTSEKDAAQQDAPFDLIIDSIYGFSFKPPNRKEDLASLLQYIHKCHTTNQATPLVCIDIPSGWHVEKGFEGLERDQADEEEKMKIPVLQPNCLVSLTAPKLGARYFTGEHHFLGGRFCPPKLAEKYKLNLPKFKEQNCIVKLN